MPVEFEMKWKNSTQVEFLKIRDTETKAEVNLGSACEVRLHCDADGNNFLCIKFPLPFINFKSKGMSGLKEKWC